MQPGFNDDRPLTPSERLGAGLFLALLLGLFGAAVFVEYEPIKLTALFFVASWAGLLVVHEAGHALAASLLGWKVLRVCLGMGRVVGRLQVGGTPVEVRTFPVMGYVVPVPRRLRRPRLENALIYLAGPVAEGLVIVAAILVVGTDKLLARTEDLGMLALQSLCLAAAVSIALNLAPHAIFTAHGPLVSDGLGFLQSFVQPLSYYEQLREVGERGELENADGQDPDERNGDRWA
jgi:hypothetical protein